MKTPGTHPPTSGVIEEGWLGGRGSSDSTVAVAIFCHLATRLAASTERLTPDLCTLNIDIRTTPTFNDIAASTLINHGIGRVDQHWPNTRPTLVQLTTRWPAYALPTNSPLRTTLLRAARTFGINVEPKIAGPSNIGNYLAGLGIPATASFGVTYTGLHATDERIRLDTIPTIQAVYHTTLLSLLSTGPADEIGGVIRQVRAAPGTTAPDQRPGTP
jgi:acetylornithine deacetylase/succinyl-diaminopimelate desuccinylase-like protein